MFPVPTSLSPSRFESFLSCPLAFRFVNIEKLPEAPSIHATLGSLVHRALELLFVLHPPLRPRDAACAALEQAIAEYHHDPEFTELHLDAVAAERFFSDARALVDCY